MIACRTRSSDNCWRACGDTLGRFGSRRGAWATDGGAVARVSVEAIRAAANQGGIELLALCSRSTLRPLSLAGLAARDTLGVDATQGGSGQTRGGNAMKRTLLIAA